MNIQQPNDRSKSKRIGVIFFTRNEDGGLIAHLERRGHSKDKDASQKWCGLSLPTLGTKRLPGEDDLDAMMRLFMTTIGKRAGKLNVFTLTSLVLGIGKDTSDTVLVQNGQTKLYGVVVPEETLKWIDPINGHGGFTEVALEDLSKIIVANDEFRHEPPDENKIVVFRHTMKALKTILPASVSRPQPALALT